MESVRKVQILDTAARLFSERGFHATSMRDLAGALDLKGGSLYSHISGKEELLWRILERAADRFGAALHPFAQGSGEPVARLRGAICAHIGVIAEDLDAATVYFHEWKFLGEPQRGAFLARRRGYEASLRALVTEALPGTDPKWATLLILSAANWLYHWYDPTGPLSPDEVADKLVGMLFEGLLLRDT